jgi:iron complex transport system substrate-binding protein
MKIISNLLIILLFSVNLYAAKIVSLSPSITEIIFALGAGQSLVGNTTYCNFPKEAKKIAKIGAYPTPSIEKIFSLHPDIVLGMKAGMSRNIKKKLDEIKIKSKFYDSNNLKDIKYIIKDIAHITNKNPDKLINEIDKLFNNKNKIKYTGVFLVSTSPFIAVGNTSFVNEILKCGGIKNIVNSKRPYPIINEEFILEKNPDIIIISSMSNNNIQNIKNMIKKFSLSSKLFIVDADIYNRPSYRIVNACMDLRKRVKSMK